MNNIIRVILRKITRDPRIYEFLKKCYMEVRKPYAPDYQIVEATPITCRASAFRAPRINLVIPSLDRQHVFGGISTALSFAAALEQQCSNLRIILTEQRVFDPQSNLDFKDWNIASKHDSDLPGRQIAAVGDRNNSTLLVGSGDRFIATAWWTASAVRQIQQWQAQVFNFQEMARSVYLIQDYEPGFYPWSGRYALAESTYRNNPRMIAVFNSGFLKSFFDTEGYRFEQAFNFEPIMNSQLKQLKTKFSDVEKVTRVLVYGRPSTDRNAFDLIVMGLKEWVGRDGRGEWEFVSAGEDHPPIELGHGKQLIALGKMSLEDYAANLAKASIGISLMISPHPSYPPLEMAAYGMRVLTNGYKAKNLSTLSPLINSVDQLDPVSMADTLTQMANDCHAGVSSDCLSSTNTVWDHYLNGEDIFSEIIPPIAAALFADDVQSLS